MTRIQLASAGAPVLSAKALAALEVALATKGVSGVELIDNGDKFAEDNFLARYDAPTLLVLPAGGARRLAALARSFSELGVNIAGLIATDDVDAARLEQLSGLPLLGAMTPVDAPAELIAPEVDAEVLPPPPDHFELDKILALAETPAKAGEVYLVGAGPGAPDLLTLRALKLIRRADVALFDRLARSAIVDLIPSFAERIYVGKRPGQHALSQGEISELMIRLAREGKRVLRLKGGDPFLFGRGGEEAEALAAAGVPFEICPGVTAASGAAASALIPLTHRDHSQACIFVTGQGKDGPTGLDWPALIRTNQTVAIYMGLANLDELMAEFIAHGAPPETPAAIVDKATRADQRVIVADIATLAREAKAAELSGPAIVFVGAVALLRAKLLAKGDRLD